MAILNNLRVSIENATTGTRYREFDDNQADRKSSVRRFQSCIEVGHDEQFRIVVTTLQDFAWSGSSNGLIVTIDFDEGLQVNRYEVVLCKEDSDGQHACSIDSLILPKLDIHQRFRFRFTELRHIEDELHNQSKIDRSRALASPEHQGRIRIEVKRVKLAPTRKSMTPDFGLPRKIIRAPKAQLRKKKITHEIELIPGEDVYDYTSKPFRSTSVKDDQVGVFIFRYSGVGIFERQGAIDSGTSSQEEPDTKHLRVFQDAYQEYAAQTLKEKAAFGQHSEAKGEKNANWKRRLRSQSADQDIRRYGGRSRNRPSSATTHQDGTENDDAAAVKDAAHSQVTQERQEGSLDAEAIQVPTLPPSDLGDCHESVLQVEDLEWRVDAFDRRLAELDTDIAGLNRRVEDCEEQAATILQKRNKLYDKLTEQQSQLTAKLQAEIDEEERKVALKKRKLAEMRDKQAQLHPAKRVRDF